MLAQGCADASADGSADCGRGSGHWRGCGRGLEGATNASALAAGARRKSGHDIEKCDARTIGNASTSIAGFNNLYRFLFDLILILAPPFPAGGAG